MAGRRSTILDSAKKEGKLKVYGTVEVDEFAGWKAAFEEKYPFIQIDYQRHYVYGTPPPLAKKIMDDVKEGKETADAAIVATPLMFQMKDLGLIRPTMLDESELPKQVRQPQGYWTPIVSIPMVQIYNPDLVKGKEIPRVADDLISAKWRDAMVTHDLSLGTLGAYWISSLRPSFGDARWTKFIDGLSKNKPRLYRLYDDVVDAVANGDAKIGLTVLLHDYEKRVEAKRPVKRLVLKDIPMMMSYNAIARTRSGKHPAAAELLIGFLLSDEGQKLIGKTYIRIPANPHVIAPYALDKLAPKEKFAVFPNEKMLLTIQDSIQKLAKKFNYGPATDSRMTTAQPALAKR